MSAVRLGSWAELRALAAPLRQAVFVDEQRVPADMEWDEYDPLSVHAVLPAPDEAPFHRKMSELVPATNLLLTTVLSVNTPNLPTSGTVWLPSLTVPLPSSW